MGVYATFDANGLPTGFWPEDVYPKTAGGGPNVAVPVGAVEISDDVHTALIEAPGAAVWNGAAVVPYAAPVALSNLQTSLCSDIDRQAEAQRLKYVTPGEAQMATYLLKRSQALGALSAQAANTAANMSVDALATAYPYLANEIGITADPTSRAPATDVYGVARAVSTIAAAWQGIDLAVEKMRLSTKAAIAAATTVATAQAAHDAVTWPAAPNS